MTASCNRRTSLVACALLLALPGLAVALESDRAKPMNIDAGHLDSSINEGISLLTGGVRIDQGTMQVRADRAEVHQDKQHQVRRAVLDGKPATLRQDLHEGGRLDARALHIDYDLGTNLVVLTGSVVVNQPKGELRGERVTYDVNTGKFTGGSEGDGGRVFLRIEPRQPATDKPAADKPAAVEPTAPDKTD